MKPAQGGITDELKPRFRLTAGAPAKFERAVWDPIGFEIVVIDSQNSRQRFTMGEMNQCRIGEIHRPIVIPSHGLVQSGHIGVGNRSQRYCTRSQESSCGCDITAVVTEQMKQLSKYRSRGSPRYTLKRRGANASVLLRRCRSDAHPATLAQGNRGACPTAGSHALPLSAAQLLYRRQGANYRPPFWPLHHIAVLCPVANQSSRLLNQSM